jgi:hypothetical protein
MQGKTLRQLVGAGRASQLAKEREELCARRLRELVHGCLRYVHDAIFAQPR